MVYFIRISAYCLSSGNIHITIHLCRRTYATMTDMLGKMLYMWRYKSYNLTMMKSKSLVRMLHFRKLQFYHRINFGFIAQYSHILDIVYICWLSFLSKYMYTFSLISNSICLHIHIININKTLRRTIDSVNHSVSVNRCLCNC